jgi:hypothetical protein
MFVSLGWVCQCRRWIIVIVSSICQHVILRKSKNRGMMDLPGLAEQSEPIRTKNEPRACPRPGRACPRTERACPRTYTRVRARTHICDVQQQQHEGPHQQRQVSSGCRSADPERDRQQRKHGIPAADVPSGTTSRCRPARLMLQ